MSKHWKPPGNVVRLRPRSGGGGWTHVGAYVAQTRRTWPRGASTGVVLVLAACVGLGIGFVQAQRMDPVADGAEIEWNAVQAVPVRKPDAEDIAWERRAQAQDSPSTGSGRAQLVQASFGYCHSGGGTNCVVDGDTFYLNGEKVRIAGIDAPETHPPRCDDEARLGEEATEKLHALLNSGAVTMTSIERDRDTYGRLLRNVAVNGEDVGEAMVSAGVAREYGAGRGPWC